MPTAFVFATPLTGLSDLTLNFMDIFWIQSLTLPPTLMFQQAESQSTSNEPLPTDYYAN
ncbi:hypothetical protein [Rubritalea tangerina]|uniref:hypothetical protein n=1 Tax=Rubritalea tangerina TaxID=430798 RepID=UPI00361BCB91